LEAGSRRFFAGFAANLDAASGGARGCRGARRLSVESQFFWIFRRFTGFFARS